MSEVTLSPRETEAVAKFDEWKNAGSDGSYMEFVAERLSPKSNGEQVTVQRAGVYVREGLAKLGRTSELPGSGTGTRKGRKPRVPLKANAMVEAALEQFDATIERLTERVENAKVQVAEFDKDAFIAERTNELEQNVKVAQAKLKAWKGNAEEQDNAANERITFLTERASTVENEVAEQLDEATAEREKLVAFAEQLA